jgi:hypothetical protein
VHAPRCGKEWHSLQLCHHGTALRQDVRAIFLIDEVGEMALQRFFIAAFLLVFKNFDDDG